MSILEKIANSKVASLKSDKLLRIIVGNVYSKIYGRLSPVATEAIDKELRYFQAGAQYSAAFRNDWWDGYIRLYNSKSQTFPTGMLSRVLKALKSRDLSFQIKDTRKTLEILEGTIQKVLSNHPQIIPRPYQLQALKSALENRTGVINIPTGSGKTLIINLIISCLDLNQPTFKHLIVTSGISLLSQLKEEIEKFQGESVGFVGEGQWDIKRITVASVESLYHYLIPPKRFSKNQSIAPSTKTEIVHDLLTNANAVYLDEAHHSPAKTFKAVFYKTTNAVYRIGTTATYMRSSGEGMLLRAVTGKVLFKKSLSWMIRNGYLAKPTLILFEFSGKDVENDENMTWHSEYKEGISANQRRNAILARIAILFYKYELSTVLFVQEKAQGELIKKLICFDDDINENKILYLTGKDSQIMVRKPALKAFKKGEVRVLICTRILNEGIDFPEANAGIRALAQKFEGGIIQQLGRILRKYKSPLSKDIDRKDEQRIFWVDLCDTHSGKLAKHSLERIKTYESEEEFELKFVNSLAKLEQIIKNRLPRVRLIKEKRTT
jgi:superfamily II DNA or RNA helicase